MSSEDQLQLADLGVSLPAEEETVLALWKRIKAFETSVAESKAEGRPKFTFYDGPPFATGLPHYGHILAGTIKDVVTRYAHQTGHHVERRFGWDTHGLPVEFEIDKKLGVTGPDMVEKEIGIANYNKECREIVMRYSKEWEHTVQRMGRWIDFENDYKTLDPTFMESVWWVFSQLQRKGLVYEGHKVMPFSIGCNTPISNFEASENYKVVQDPTVVAAFPLTDDPETAFVAWTTTPWTLPSNLALCVHPTLKYVKVRDLKAGRNFIIAEDRLCQLFASAPKPQGEADADVKKASFGSKKKKKKGKKGKKGGDAAEQPKADEAQKKQEEEAAAAAAAAKPDEKEYEVLATYEGKDLGGMRYEPLFPYFKETFGETAFRIVVDEYVTATDGTGIVHNAPGHGEDDHRVCEREGVITKQTGIACPVDSTGRYTEEVSDFKGMYVKDADREIIRALRKRNLIVQESNLSHSYPHCWRSDTPLIYMAVPSWYVDVPAIKERLLANNEETYWVPDSVKTRRFRNWLADARPWSVSRNRFWGTPIPIWRSEDKEQMVVIGSVDELKRLSGREDITDLHRDSIDDIEIPDPRGAEFPPMRRVPEVFDCWFESGSMPYAQQHYPFENKESFEKNFPADFIAEGLDQTRGWFYTLMVISTALFDKPAFKNLVVNGLVLATDGEKMSKRKRNYDPPLEVVSVHGADAVRLYLINSPVVRAEPLKFKTEGVRDVVKTLLLPWYHTYRLLCEQSVRQAGEAGSPFRPSSVAELTADGANIMDRWVLAALQDVIAFTRAEMAAYRLYTVVPALVAFIDQLSNWYVRFNKSRLKGLSGAADSQSSLSTLFVVLHTLCRLMAPFTPFMVETMYQNLRRVLPEGERRESVHYLMVPEVDESVRSHEIVEAVNVLKTVVELGRTARESTKVGWKTPLPRVQVLVRADDAHILDALRPLASYVRSELNVREVDFSTDLSECVLKAEPNRRSLGQRLGNKMGAACRAIRALGNDELVQLSKDGKLALSTGDEVTPEDACLAWDWKGDHDKWTNAANVERGVMVVLRHEPDESCVAEGHVREVMSKVQAMRKEAGLLVLDRVVAYHSGDGPVLASMASGEWHEYVERKFPFRARASMPADAKPVAEKEFEYAGEKITLAIVRAE